MSDPVIPDTRCGHWWGVLFPRPTQQASWPSQVASVLVVAPSLFLGLLIASLHVLTLPVLFVALLIVHVVKGDARIRSQERNARFTHSNAS